MVIAEGWLVGLVLDLYSEIVSLICIDLGAVFLQLSSSLVPISQFY